MKIGFLCNSRIGLPAFEMLLQHKISISLVLPNSHSEENDYLEKLAVSHKINPYRIAKQTVEQELKEWYDKEAPDIIVVLTFPFIIPETLLQTKTPWFNFHFAPLPEYRGAEPIFWLLKNREKEGGVSVHVMTKNLDAGSIVFIEPVPIEPTDTHGMHYTKLSMVGAGALAKLLQYWQQQGNDINTTAQNDEKSRTYAKPCLSDLIIDWDTMGREEIRALVNAGNPWNKGAITFLEGKPLRIASVNLPEMSITQENTPGRLYVDEQGNLRASTKDSKDLIISIVSLEEGIYIGKEFAQTYAVENKILNNNF